jgi:hypothetical protein
MPLRGLPMKKMHTTPNGTEVSDEHVFAIRLFIYTESNFELSLPIVSILKLVDIFEELGDNQYA